jgi:hypothetical protein
MTVPFEYQNRYVSVKYFLTTYRALSDGKFAIRQLEEHLKSDSFLFSDWKVIWIGACTILRTSIDLFRVDSRSCINERLREEILAEWRSIDANRDDHQIFWKFLRQERNNILHEYKWSAYEVWLDREGVERPARFSLLEVRPDDVRSIIVMKNGPYKGRNTLELLSEGAEWVEARIFAAIRRAELDPEEMRDLVTFQPPPSSPGLLSLFSGIDSSSQD